MSRIGKKIIKIPKDVQIEITGNLIKIKGPKGNLERRFFDKIGIEQSEQGLSLSPKSNDHQTKMNWGTERSIIANLVQGVSEGYEKVLELEGIGYKAQVKGNGLQLNIGFSHPVDIEEVPGINFKVEKNAITVSGIDKTLVGQVAANIRKIRPPEPYKGKGIRYRGEIVRKKAGKKAASAAS